MAELEVKIKVIIIKQSKKVQKIEIRSLNCVNFRYSRNMSGK
ncbi:hypothetical protein [Enterococcus sp. DIV0187]